MKFFNIIIPISVFLQKKKKHVAFTKVVQENVLSFYIGLAMQLIGFASVGLCLFAGMSKGDYGHLELVQFIGGSAVFYIGTVIKSRANS